MEPTPAAAKALSISRELEGLSFKIRKIPFTADYRETTNLAATWTVLHTLYYRARMQSITVTQADLVNTAEPICGTSARRLIQRLATDGWITIADREQPDDFTPRRLSQQVLPTQKLLDIFERVRT